MDISSRIDAVQRKLDKIRELSSERNLAYVEQMLEQENNDIREQIAALLTKLQMNEMLFVLQHKSSEKLSFQTPVSTSIDLQSAPKSEAPVGSSTKTPTTKSSETVPSQAVTKTPADKNNKTAAPVSTSSVDVGRLSLRVGRIVEVSRHPDADSLYVEKVDLGEGKLRTVVSGLVKFVPLEALQNRLGIFMCNLKPAKMRGVESEAMLMCASDPDNAGVEPLILDSSDVPLGESVVVPGYTHNPDDQLNPKKKIFEQVKPDLRVDSDGFATYKGVRWTLERHPGVSVKSTRLRDVQIA